jgi:hypothetical protein
VSDQQQALMQFLGVKPAAFPANSRYHGVETAVMVGSQPSAASGKLEERAIVYLRRRFVPDPAKFVVVQEHTVTQGERVDRLAAKYIGDPEQFWRICDANNVLDPNELTDTLGRRVHITLPEGFPGVKSG